MGEVRVPQSAHYGAQTARSLVHFAIGTETMPEEVLRALILLKEAAAKTNLSLGVLEEEKARAIMEVCGELLGDTTEGIAPAYRKDFPLHVWQTGSGTQTNMNVNEVIAYLANAKDDTLHLHPNDHVNRSQSSNDTFPTAMHVAALCAIEQRLFPAMEEMSAVLSDLEEAHRDVLKIGRTHLMDAVPLTFAQELSGYRTMIDTARAMIADTLPYLRQLAIGGTAVGTGLNCPEGFADRCAVEISARTGTKFVSAPNKFHALSAKDACVHTHGALKALACDLMKIAQDVRLMASGPRAGLHEITIPANEPGSSIMPGKVNPTQCEALTMVCAQVIGNDTAVAVGAAGGQFELNVFLPLIAHNLMQSVRLLADAVSSFTAHCLKGLAADRKTMEENVARSLMLVTALTPAIGYEQAAMAAHKAHAEGLTLREAVLSLSLMDEAAFDEAIRPENMV